MKILKPIIFLFLLSIVFAFKSKKESFNLCDQYGQKQGLWMIFGIDRPEAGFLPDQKIFEGYYQDDRRSGKWKFFYKGLAQCKLEGEYEAGVPNGEFSSFYKNGQLKVKGKFVNDHYQDQYLLYHENGELAQEKFFDKNGQENGVTTYFYENGEMELQYTKRHGVLIGTSTWYDEDGDIKRQVNY